MNMPSKIKASGCEGDEAFMTTDNKLNSKPANQTGQSEKKHLPLSQVKKKSLIESELLTHIGQVLKVLLPAGKNTGKDFRVGDVYGKAGKSLSVCLQGKKKGLWNDFSTNDGGNLLGLIAAHHGLNIKSNLKSVLDKAQNILDGLDANEITTSPKPLVAGENKSMKKVTDWDYLNSDKTYICTVIRFEDSDGKKSFRPYNKQTKQYKAHPEPRPLYNLSGISKSDSVILVEGEKCAQALIEAGYCATTAMMGANAPSSKTDWSPLKDKDVLIWPDNDVVGNDYAMNCAEAALAAGAKSCAIFKIPNGMPEGWDVADGLTSAPIFDVDAFVNGGEKLQITQSNNLALIEALNESDWKTEDGIASALSLVYGPDWKYCAGWGQWHYWDGRRWVHDTILVFKYKVREVCRAASMLVDDKTQHLRAKIASAATVYNIERLARADPIHATSFEMWDADPMLLNTTGGIINLSTGNLVPHERNKFLTKSATATPEGDCPRWLEFLAVITGENHELIAYLQRVIGYCLTGLTTEHALFFLYGTGANGKSVFLNVISAILGDYAKTAPIDTFMDTRSDRHPTDLAGLRGARFVCAIETEQGRRWNESKIKAITGGDMISARFMRQDFFEFKPQFKLLIAGNHKPSISNVDEAMSRRIHLIPFTIFISPDKRDKSLTEKLLKERNGILAWAVQGLMQWQALGGLQPPEVVTKATQEYLDAEDAVGRWIEDCCEIDSSAFSPSKWLFESWKSWADEYGEYRGTSRRLSEQLIAKKFEACRQNKVRGFKGILVKENFSFLNTQTMPIKSTQKELEAQL